MRSVMESYTQEINEAVENARKLADQIRKVYHKHFPKSFIFVEYRKNLLPSITMHIGLGKDKSEWANGIMQNDPMHAIFMIELDRVIVDKETGDFDGVITVQRISGTGLLDTNYDRIKVPFRKTTGNTKTLLTTLDRHFGRLKDAVKTNMHNLKVSGTPLVPADKVR